MATYGIDRDVPLPAEAPPPPASRIAAPRAEAPPPVISAIPYAGESDDIRAWRRELREARSILLHVHLVMVAQIERAAKAIMALEKLGVEA